MQVNLPNVVFPVRPLIYKILFMTAGAEVVGDDVGVVVVVVTVDGTAVVGEDVVGVVVKGVTDVSSHK